MISGHFCPSLSISAMLSLNVLSCIVHVCIFVLQGPLLHCPSMQHRPSMSCPPLSMPVFFFVLQCPLLHFQSSRLYMGGSRIFRWGDESGNWACVGVKVQ